jgi:hypothetical protein
MTTDLNDRIAKAKGWSYEEVEYHIGKPFVSKWWHNPEGKPAIRSDFIGTLEGLAALIRDLNDRGAQISCKWKPGFGICIGETWLSVFEKEAADASPE